MDDNQSKVVDPMAEISAMQSISTALKGLDPAQVSRVLSWANNLYLSKEVSKVVSTPTPQEGSVQEHTYEEESNTAYDDVADFFALLSPRSDMDKALVVSYWLQVYGGRPDLDSHSVNNELKHLGYKVTNITRAFDGLTSTKPQLVIQTRRSGSSAQARKKFKVTHAGIRKVEQQLKEAEVGM